jgi:hypothetical protein
VTRRSSRDDGDDDAGIGEGEVGGGELKGEESQEDLRYLYYHRCR